MIYSSIKTEICFTEAKPYDKNSIFNAETEINKLIATVMLDGALWELIKYSFVVVRDQQMHALIFGQNN
tara:strand:+ start:5 stop:211 length:207 start_codon:yes stop_codon:yes gene_type:complete